MRYHQPLTTQHSPEHPVGSAQRTHSDHFAINIVKCVRTGPRWETVPTNLDILPKRLSGLVGQGIERLKAFLAHIHRRQADGQYDATRKAGPDVPISTEPEAAGCRPVAWAVSAQEL